MRKNQSSLTALGIAMARAVESEKPEGERICYDPFARQFVAGWMVPLMRFFIKTGYTEWRGPGVNGFLVARDRYIDDTLHRYLQTGLHQLVILGAGFDSRAYRVEGFQDHVNVFEVDHPATQRDKITRLKGILGKMPDWVTFVPIDFNTQTLPDCLAESGYDPCRKTLFIWQGVTMYLTAQAVDATLATVTRGSGPGSAIVFDYIYRDVLESAHANSEMRSMNRYRFMSGEGLTFGIPKGAIEAFLKERGFRSVQDASAEDLKKAYFTGKNAARKIASGYGIAVGEI